MNSSVQGTTNTPMLLGKVRIGGLLCTVGGAGWLVNGVLFPFIFITGEPNLLAIAGWGPT
jgi:hypothetical protein